MNVANQITDIALKYPHKRSVVMPHRSYFSQNYRYEHLTFIGLEQRINQFSHRLTKYGVKRGDRVLLFVKPSIDFSVYTFALFKIGAVPVLIDPGMGVKNFLQAVKQVKADVLLGIPKAHLLSILFKKYFTSIRLKLSTSKFPLIAKSMTRDLGDELSLFDSASMTESEPAAILFTSGGTGIPKGVVYTHSIFIEQTRMLQTEFSLTSTDVDIPGFPLFALFTLAMGMTSCIPDMNPSKPSKAKAKRLLRNIMDQGATFVAGSPAIWKNLAKYCIENRITLPSVEHLVMFGAPIPLSLHKDFKKILPNGTTYTPYGATECLPVSNMSGREILTNNNKDTSDDISLADKSLGGAGTCIGRPFNGVEIKVISSSLNPLKEKDIESLPAYSIGEIIVKSKTVTPFYFDMPEKTNLAKIYTSDGLWHRMGDMGYFDDKGLLWFCGRQSHSFCSSGRDYYPIPIETIFNQHDEIEKSAIVRDRENSPVLFIQRKDKKVGLTKTRMKQFESELLSLGQKFSISSDINQFKLKDKLPVDVRHNIKIDRLALAKELASMDSRK